MRGLLAAPAGQASWAPAQSAAAPTAPGYWDKAYAFLFLTMSVVVVRLHEYIPGSGIIKPVFSVTILTVALLYSKTSRRARKNIASHPLARFVYLYYVCILASVPFGLWPGGSVNIARFFLPAVLCFATFHFVAPTRRALEWAIFAFVANALILAFTAQTLGRTGMGRLRLQGSFDVNDTASIFAMALPIAMGILMRSAPGRSRIAAILSVFALVTGTIASGSRGGTLAMLAGATVFILGMRGPKAIIVLAAMLLGGAIAWRTAPPFFRNRMMSLTHLEDDYNTTSETGRKAVWARARIYIREHPVLGVGAGNFVIAEGYNNEMTGRTGKWSAAHNAYLQALAELGFIGGGTYILMLLMAGFTAFRFWRPMQRKRGPPRMEYPELLASISAFAVGATFLSHAYYHPMFAVLGIITLADRVRIAESRGGYAPQPARVGAPAPPGPVKMGERGGLGSFGVHPASGQRGALAGRQLQPGSNR